MCKGIMESWFRILATEFGSIAVFAIGDRCYRCRRGTRVFCQQDNGSSSFFVIDADGSRVEVKRLVATHFKCSAWTSGQGTSKHYWAATGLPLKKVRMGGYLVCNSRFESNC